MKTNITTTDKKPAIKREECICNQLRNAHLISPDVNLLVY